MSHEKCHCKHYEGGDHRAPLIKLDIPEYEDYRYGGTSHIILRALRIIVYVTVLALLFYSLWRIRVIEAKIEADDRLSNLSRIIQSSNAFHNKRTTRSIQDQLLMNSFGHEKGMMNPSTWKRPTNKNEFDKLVNDLFDKIKTMHDDQERGHFDRNMKAVFQAWFPVFDALLPKELKEDAEIRKTRDVGNQEYVYKPNKEKDESDESSSEESDKKEMKKKKKKDSVSSEESEEHKNRNLPCITMKRVINKNKSMGC